MTGENRDSTTTSTEAQRAPGADRKTDARERDSPTKKASEKEGAPKDRAPEPKPEVKEDPEEWADPICVCEAEPYWQEVAERLEREKGSSHRR